MDKKNRWLDAYINGRNIGSNNSINNIIIMKKEKINVITSGKMDAEGWKKVGKSFLITLAGAAIVFIGDLANIASFGSWQMYAATVFPWIANLLRKWLGVYKTKK